MESCSDLPAQPAQLLEYLAAYQVLYYPIADLDNQPLQLVGDVIDVILLVDWRYDESEFDTIVDILLKAEGPTGSRLYTCQQAVFQIPASEMLAITGRCSNFDLFSEPAWVRSRQPWGCITRLIRRDGVPGPWLVYIAGDCTEIYERLFIDHGTAPKFLWLQCPLSANVDGWSEFISVHGRFGRMFTKAANQPDYVVAHRCQPGWAHTVPRQRFPAWHPAFELTAFARPDQRVNFG